MMTPTDPDVPEWLKNDLEELKKGMRDLPDLLERTFVRKDIFKEYRDGMDRRLSEIGTEVVDLHGDLKLVQRDVENAEKATQKREMAATERALGLANEARKAGRKIWWAIAVGIGSGVASGAAAAILTHSLTK